MDFIDLRHPFYLIMSLVPAMARHIDQKKWYIQDKNVLCMQSFS